ncbi:hypothetical protein EXE48_12770 [Halorubrum sp. ASP1]|uniref:hypothetical protein n=1 Tax=Halorubrum sp. ASP1 TaxID=2518114 RepID=UPI0010F5629B|nr:hypothetical protein [Halorubrum sp. ASP1]TKX60441.1 hypothetical protein EXE48_12770 [Halorubrum sp. ASP1]
MAAVISVVISGLLLQVYRNQNQLKKLEQRPIIHAEGFRVKQGNELLIDTENYGRGSATGMHVRTTLQPIDVRKPGSIRSRFVLWAKKRLPKQSSLTETRLTSQQIQQNNEDEADHQWKEIYGTKLGPGEDKKYVLELSLNTNPNIIPNGIYKRWRRFLGWLPLCASGHGDDTYVFNSAVGILSRSGSAPPRDGGDDESDSTDPTEKIVHGISHYRMRANLYYSDPTGSTHSERVFDYVFPAVDQTNLENAFETGRPYEEFIQSRETYHQSANELINS